MLFLPFLLFYRVLYILPFYSMKWYLYIEAISMKVIAFNGSARKQGNTAILINHVFSELEKEGIETELVELAGKKIQGCTACYKCFETKDRKCSVKNAIVNDCIEKMMEPEGIT